MSETSIRQAALRTIKLESEAIACLDQSIDDQFVQAVQAIASTRGRLIVSGVGKSAIVAQKIVATLNSTGTPAVFMHAGDAIHGDLGMIQPGDILMLISKSGESPEIKVLLPLLRNFGNKLIALAGNEKSLLAKQADFFLSCRVEQEACPNNLAPTSSTTAQMVMGDALAVALMELNGFNSADFARFHPGGTLGKRLYLRVEDLSVHNEKPKVFADTSLKAVIMEMTSKRLGATAVIDQDGLLIGIITDGDLRRMLEKDIEPGKVFARDIMSVRPKTIAAEALAADALEALRAYDITQLVVVTPENKYEGFIHLHDLIREGII